jgi:hypothetical protein
VAFFSLPLTVSVTTNITEAGTVTGAGTFDYGNTCTLTATPNDGYLFLHWSKNGEVVSCNATYSFTVTEDDEIEAVFMLLEGTLIGAGELTNNYLPSFSNYRYTLSQQIYTPNEIGEAGNIITVAYFNAGVTMTRSYNIYMVHTDKTVFDNNTDWITVTEADLVFSGSVTMTKGYWTTIVLNTPFAYNGTSNLAIIIDDNTGTWSSSMACRVFNANGNQAIRVYSDNTNYDPMSPPTSYASGNYASLHSVKNQMILGIVQVQQINLSEGWNWWSTYIEADDVLAQLEASLGTNGMQISTTGGGLTYRNGRWIGTISSIDNAKGYKIRTNAPVTVTIEGSIVNPDSCLITINEGWNWIGYPLTESQTVGTALAGFTPSNGDNIKTQGGGATYRNGNWLPASFTLEPGKSYAYKSTSSQSKTLVFQTGAKARRAYPNFGKSKEQLKEVNPTH